MKRSDLRLLPLALAAAAAACSTSREPAPDVARAAAPAVVVKPDSARPPAYSALAAPDAAWVERTLRSLSLREKAGQMVLAWISGRYTGPGDEEMQRASQWVRRDRVGGFIISVGTPREFAAKVNALQRNAPVPLIFVTDLESGPGMRLIGSGTDFPPVMGLAATGSDSLAFAVGRVIGREGRAVGLGLTLSPVLDVNSNPLNPIINTRSFGEDPAAVGRFAADYVRGVHAGGLLAMGKHFPGHGDTHTDSHMDLPSVDADRARLDRVDLPPFRTAIAAGMDGVLVAHIAVPRVTGDDVPASVSPRLTRALLRDEMGFRGLVMTDAFNMRGLTNRYGQGDAAVRAIDAGADILLQPTDIPAVLNAIEAAVRGGRLSEARIDQSVRRILESKSRVRLERDRYADANLASVVGSEPHRRLAMEVAQRSITLVRDRRNLVPLAAGARRILSITYSEGGGTAGTVFNASLAGPDRTVDAVRATDATAFATLRDRAAAADLVVVSAYVTPREYRGSVEAGGGFARFVEQLAATGKPLVVISFGSPYLLRSFPSVPAYVAAWGREAVCQEAAARALLGLAPIGGRLPVGITPDAPRGTGIMRAATGR
ncbi:MAG TPA: glycoside hydrolase family 3 N-terminal domain-containing protein [Longimicrobium sp.]|nr:glycoside hydrolase family 3 N-terminal domain-containing protein [Longimicrobium sp.]